VIIWALYSDIEDAYRDFRNHSLQTTLLRIWSPYIEAFSGTASRTRADARARRRGFPGTQYAITKLRLERAP